MGQHLRSSATVTSPAVVVFATLALLLLPKALVVAQLSAPITHDSHVNTDGNKFLEKTAELDKSGHL